MKLSSICAFFAWHVNLTKTTTAAVTLAVQEQIRRAKLKRLANKLGSIAVDDEAIAKSHQANHEREKLLDQIGVFRC